MKQFQFAYSPILEHRKRQYTSARMDYEHWKGEKQKAEQLIASLERHMTEEKNKWLKLMSASDLSISEMQFQNWYLESLERQMKHLEKSLEKVTVVLDGSQAHCVEKMREKKMLDHLHDQQLTSHLQRVDKAEQEMSDEHFLAGRKKSC